MKKGLMIFSSNMEDVESLATRALLVRAGLDITTATPEDQLEIKTAFGQMIKVDAYLKSLDLELFDFLVIPGGKYVSEVISKDVLIKKTALAFNQQGKMIGAICAGPRFLGQAGILDHKKFTCFKGSEIDMPKGDYHPELKALTDGHIITARGAGAVYEFAYEIVSYQLGKDKANMLLSQILY